MWVWHIPALYDLALEHPLVHVLEHIVLHGRRARCTGGTSCRRSATGTSAAWGRSSTWPRRSSSSGALGIALTFAPGGAVRVLRGPAALLGPDAPATDQAVGGLIMALEQSIIMGIALVVLFVRALSESEREEQRRERFGEA